jgi:hypothetical protein
MSSAACEPIELDLPRFIIGSVIALCRCNKKGGIEAPVSGSAVMLNVFESEFAFEIRLLAVVALFLFLFLFLFAFVFVFVYVLRGDGDIFTSHFDVLK